MRTAPHVRVIVLLGFITTFSAGCTSTTPNDATPIVQTPALVVATAAPVDQPTTLAQPPTSAPPTPVVLAIGMTAIPATIVQPSLPTSSSPPTAAVSASPAPATPAGDDLEGTLIILINQKRAAAGCAIPMTQSPALTTAASRHSQDMSTHHFFGHTGSDGSTRASRAQDAGYIVAAGERVRENIAMYAEPADVLNNWMQTPITRDQMLDCDYNDIGIGYAEISNGQPNKYWTALFGVRQS